MTKEAGPDAAGDAKPHINIIVTCVEKLKQRVPAHPSI